MHNICDNVCHICKANSEYCCGYFHKFHCNDYFIHNCKLYNEINNHYIYRKTTSGFIKNFDDKVKFKNFINDYPKDWIIFEYNEDKEISYCK